MKISVHGTEFPREIEVGAEVVLADPSKRIKPSIRLVITWVRPDGSEWGTTQLIPIEE